MWWPFQWLFIYILGGFTFIPLVIVLVIGYVYKYGSVPIGDDDSSKRVKAAIQSRYERDELIENDKAKETGKAISPKPLSGWLTIRRQFNSSTQTSSIFVPSTVVQNDLSVAEVEDSVSDRDDISIKSGTTTPNPQTTSTSIPSSVATPIPGQPTTYSARIAQTYRQMMDARAKKESPPKEYLYCVLKGQVMFLYEDETQSECVAAICVDKYIVGVEGKEGGRFTGKDAEMFAKRNAIVLRVQEKDKDGDEKSGLPSLVKGMEGNAGKSDEKEVESAPWFIFSKSNTKMEDWYLALTMASALSPDTTNVFSENDMQALVNTIDTEPDPIPMRWLNAMIGRIFFGIYRTEALEQLIIGRIMKKLTKVPRPSFLGPIIIREVNVGTFPPVFSKPMLKDLTAEGTASFEVHLNYRARPSQPNSEIRITIATSATIPTGFKPYVVDLVLAVVVKSFEGNLVMQIKKPPSNRVWYGFTQMPKMEIEIQPVVSERKIQIGMILKAIEKQLREVIAESVVLPNMDDIAFFDTSDLDIRGGIFSAAGKVVNGPTTDVPAGGVEAPTQPGVEISTSAEGPLPLTTESSGLRKRQPAKSQTIDTQVKLVVTGQGVEGERSITRQDTAPAQLAALGNTTKLGSGQPAKKWFGTNGRPPSISSLAAIAPLNASKERIEKALNAEKEQGQNQSSQFDSLAPIVTETSSLPPNESRAETVHGSPTSSLRSTGRTSLDISGTNPTTAGSGEGEPPSSPAQSTASTASLMASLRTRDKKAIISQANTARDAVKKWGVNWAAKRKQLGAALEGEEEIKPKPIYRPADEDVDINASTSTRLSRSADGPKSLQERLNAAAASAGRAKSDSVSSTSPSLPATIRPSLQPSPSKTSISSLGTSPPQWKLSTGTPTTEIAKGDITKPATSIASRTPPKSTVEAGTRPRTSIETMERRASNSTPVFTQPTAGKSMVVPRMPKRPGEVVSIGSSEAGITRRISSGEEGTERVVEPYLPARPTSGEVRREDATVLPPKLPSRKVTPTVSPKVESSGLPMTDQEGPGSSGSRMTTSSTDQHNVPVARSESLHTETTIPPRLPDRAGQTVEPELLPDDTKGMSIDSNMEGDRSQKSDLLLSNEDEIKLLADELGSEPARREGAGSAEGILRDLKLRDERGRASSIGEGESIGTRL